MRPFSALLCLSAFFALLIATVAQVNPQFVSLESIPSSLSAGSVFQSVSFYETTPPVATFTANSAESFKAKPLTIANTILVTTTNSNVFTFAVRDSISREKDDLSDNMTFTLTVSLHTDDDSRVVKQASCKCTEPGMSYGWEHDDIASSFFGPTCSSREPGETWIMTATSSQSSCFYNSNTKSYDVKIVPNFSTAYKKEGFFKLTMTGVANNFSEVNTNVMFRTRPTFMSSKTSVPPYTLVSSTWVSQFDTSSSPLTLNTVNYPVNGGGEVTIKFKMQDVFGNALWPMPYSETDLRMWPQAITTTQVIPLSGTVEDQYVKNRGTENEINTSTLPLGSPYFFSECEPIWSHSFWINLEAEGDHKASLVQTGASSATALSATTISVLPLSPPAAGHASSKLTSTVDSISSDGFPVKTDTFTVNAMFFNDYFASDISNPNSLKYAFYGPSPFEFISTIDMSDASEFEIIAEPSENLSVCPQLSCSASSPEFPYNCCNAAGKCKFDASGPRSLPVSCIYTWKKLDLLEENDQVPETTTTMSLVIDMLDITDVKADPKTSYLINPLKTSYTVASSEVLELQLLVLDDNTKILAGTKSEVLFYIQKDDQECSYSPSGEATGSGCVLFATMDPKTGRFILPLVSVTTVGVYNLRCSIDDTPCTLVPDTSFTILINPNDYGLDFTAISLVSTVPNIHKTVTSKESLTDLQVDITDNSLFLAQYAYQGVSYTYKAQFFDSYGNRHTEPSSTILRLNLVSSVDITTPDILTCYSSDEDRPLSSPGAVDVLFSSTDSTCVWEASSQSYRVNIKYISRVRASIITIAPTRGDSTNVVTTSFTSLPLMSPIIQSLKTVRVLLPDTTEWVDASTSSETGYPAGTIFAEQLFIKDEMGTIYDQFQIDETTFFPTLIPTVSYSQGGASLSDKEVSIDSPIKTGENQWDYRYTIYLASSPSFYVDIAYFDVSIASNRFIGSSNVIILPGAPIMAKFDNNMVKTTTITPNIADRTQIPLKTVSITTTVTVTLQDRYGSLVALTDVDAAALTVDKILSKTTNNMDCPAPKCTSLSDNKCCTPNAGICTVTFSYTPQTAALECSYTYFDFYLSTGRTGLGAAPIDEEEVAAVNTISIPEIDPSVYEYRCKYQVRNDKNKQEIYKDIDAYLFCDDNAFSDFCSSRQTHCGLLVQQKVCYDVVSRTVATNDELCLGDDANTVSTQDPNLFSVGKQIDTTLGSCDGKMTDLQCSIYSQSDNNTASSPVITNIVLIFALFVFFLF